MGELDRRFLCGQVRHNLVVGDHTVGSVELMRRVWSGRAVARDGFVRMLSVGATVNRISQG